MKTNLDAKLYGTDLFGDPIQDNKPVGAVAEKFLISPFTVLDTKQGYWQKRKKAWLGVGITSEIGREASDAVGSLLKSMNNYDKELGRKGERKEFSTSIFDPVLTELAYRWFCPKNGQIVDPFAGGSVRGVIASLLDYKYWGSDLREEQINANKKQVNDICEENIPEYVCGDSLQTLDTAPDADFIFSCPPYGDLEKYSDMERDLSNMEFHTFVAAYSRIILKSVKRLKNDRFACFVVGDFRDKKGFYRNFVSETIKAFEVCGARLYNEAILLTSVGSASMRVTKQFNGGRKLCKTHQNVLVFCKGNWKKATQAIMAK